jgi:hypothetical protein
MSSALSSAFCSGRGINGAQQLQLETEVTAQLTAPWAGYYARTPGREPRSLLLAACAELGAGDGRMAIDLGCGDGKEAVELLARHEVDVLLDDLQILRLDETERDGPAFTGLKHWHTFDILARKPIGAPPPG